MLFFTLGGFALSDQVSAPRVSGGQQLPLCILPAQFTEVPAVMADRQLLASCCFMLTEQTHSTKTQHSLFSLDGVHRSHIVTGNVAAAPSGQRAGVPPVPFTETQRGQRSEKGHLPSSSISW